MSHTVLESPQSKGPNQKPVKSYYFYDFFLQVIFINRELVNRGVARWYEVDADENIITKNQLD